tara:strand:+ start:41 stop:748 length:708 start_codon:yes stop_codon:yes gene_type:complete
MPRIPTNARLFGEYVLGKQSPITEKDFTPQELSQMLRMIEQQDTRNTEKEKDLQRSLASYQRNLETFEPSENLVQDKKGNLVPKYTEKEYNKEIQNNIKTVERQLASYEKTRDKTAVGYRKERADPEGLKLIDALSQSFTSPAYNIETTLGHFSARKNKDGTVSIKDTYDFLGYGNTKPVKFSMSDFIKALPSAITKPEAFGTLLSRAFLADRKRDVDITLDSKAKTAKTFKEAL